MKTRNTKAALINKGFALFALLLISLPAWPLAGFIHPPKDGLMIGLNENIELDGRVFDIYVPENNRGSLPLVLDLHGHTLDQKIQRGISRLQDLAEKEGFVIAWPLGTGTEPSWNGGRCCGEAVANNVDDVTAMIKLVDWIAGQLTIDLNRVYATGISNGGAMAHRLALEAPHVFAAAVPVAFPFDYDHPAIMDKKPSRAVPVLLIHGRFDQFTPYPCSEWGCVEEGMQHWAYLNQCDPEPARVWQNALGAYHDIYQNCAPGGASELLLLTTGHFPYVINFDGVDASREIWSFLSQHSLF